MTTLDQHIKDYLHHVDPGGESPTLDEMESMRRGFQAECDSGCTWEELYTPQYDPSILDGQYMLPISTASTKSAHGRKIKHR